MRLLLLTVLLFQTTQCARILGIFYFPSYSHYIVGETLFKELAARGHEVTVISSMPQKEPIKNFRDVPITELDKHMKGVLSNDMMKMVLNPPPTMFFLLGTLSIFKETAAIALSDPNMQNFLKSNETFDLIITEYFFNEAHLGFAHHFKVPVVLFHTSASSLLTSSFMANPTPFAYIPHSLHNFKPKMDFLQRAYNTFLSSLQLFLFYAFVLPQQNGILHTYFPDAPPVKDLMKNVSLLFLNSHPTVGAAVPLQPNMIEVGGLHLHKYKPLTDDLKKYLDDAKEGVVYVSMGSNVRSADFPVDRREGLMRALSKLKMKVLWKFEEDLANKPPNVRIEKWLPQPAVLAHKNVKLFVTHGGRLSIIETVYFGKPILGIPLFAEQRVNVQEAVQFGYGLELDFSKLADDEHVSELMREMLENPSYAEVAKYRSKALHSLPSNPMDTAVYWIESVILHKGLPHLKNAGIDLEWYQLLLLDVLLFYVVATWLIIKLFSVILSKLFRMCKRKEKLKKN